MSIGLDFCLSSGGRGLQYRSRSFDYSFVAMCVLGDYHLLSCEEKHSKDHIFENIVLNSQEFSEASQHVFDQRGQTRARISHKKEGWGRICGHMRQIKDPRVLYPLIIVQYSLERRLSSVKRRIISSQTTTYTKVSSRSGLEVRTSVSNLGDVRFKDTSQLFAVMYGLLRKFEFVSKELQLFVWGFFKMFSKLYEACQNLTFVV